MFRARVGRGTVADQGPAARPGRRSPASATCWPTRRCGGPGSPRAARPASCPPRSSTTCAARCARPPATRSAQGGVHTGSFVRARGAAASCPRCGADARARDDRRAHDVLVPAPARREFSTLSWPPGRPLDPGRARRDTRGRGGRSRASRGGEPAGGGARCRRPGQRALGPHAHPRPDDAGERDGAAAHGRQRVREPHARRGRRPRANRARDGLRPLRRLGPGRQPGRRPSRRRGGHGRRRGPPRLGDRLARHRPRRPRPRARAGPRGPAGHGPGGHARDAGAGRRDGARGRTHRRGEPRVGLVPRAGAAPAPCARRARRPGLRPALPPPRARPRPLGLGLRRGGHRQDLRGQLGARHVPGPSGARGRRAALEGDQDGRRQGRDAARGADRGLRRRRRPLHLARHAAEDHLAARRTAATASTSTWTTRAPSPSWTPPPPSPTPSGSVARRCASR